MNICRFSELSSIVNDVSRETLLDFEIYENLLYKWQKKINLIGDASLFDVWRRHFLDSAQLFPLAKSSKNWLDVGSGGGFPGLVLAILMKHMGNGSITLIESNRKKAAFLHMVVSHLRLPAQILNQRIETTYPIIKTTPDVITARALADLPELLTLIAPFFGQQTLALLQKGRNFLRLVF